MMGSIGGAVISTVASQRQEGSGIVENGWIVS